MNPNHNLEVTGRNPAIQAMMEGRSEIAETRLAVTATQIVERMQLRSVHLKELLDEELEVDSKVQQTENVSSGDFMGLESALTQQSTRIRSDRRRENTECWRDLSHVMRDFLNAWEGFTRNEAKNRFLSALPKTSSPQGTVPNTYNHDTNNNHYNQR
jgi:hypothetical protein